MVDGGERSTNVISGLNVVSVSERFWDRAMRSISTIDGSSSTLPLECCSVVVMASPAQDVLTNFETTHARGFFRLDSCSGVASLDRKLFGFRSNLAAASLATSVAVVYKPVADKECHVSEQQWDNSHANEIHVQ